jgi:hypothetical protein
MATIENSSPGWKRFDFYLQQLQAALTKAEATENPGLSLYQQNVRTPVFMLEALTRLYSSICNKKIFEKLNKRFKTFEDLLGAVDYYDGFGKEFSTKNNIPAAIGDFIKAGMENKLEELNQVLTDGGWTGLNNKRMKKITSKLAKTDWPNEEDDVAGVSRYYQKSISKIIKSIEENDINFDNVEEDVHELRRELRWLSIYPQALRGLIQMKPTVDSPDYLKKYLTTEIVNSPFNKMPGPGELKDIIYVSANYFYALSWLIAELGKLKDNGLRIVILKEALQSTDKLSEEEAEKQALSFCGEDQNTTSEILKRSKEIGEQFFNEKILEQLVLIS